MEIFLSAVMIMCMRIVDVTLSTIRTLMVVQGRKYYAGILGFIEVTIWVLAIRHIMMHIDNLWNILGYSTGFGLGNIIGITLEQKFGLGFVQIYIISLHYADEIANELRRKKFGVTILPGEGGSGGQAILVSIIARKRQKEFLEIVESIDPKAFITIQPATPYRGYIQTKS
ncbi:MAG: DUF5698 domain-containing protein [Ignavibacteria bacterium]|nr:DUF5698 domain-containing protein [Ignavibacteria bacterium]